VRIIYIFLFNSLIAFSQQKGIVYYGFIDALGTGNAKGIDSNAYMTFNKEQSYYVTAKDSLEKAEKINEQKTYLKEGGGGAIYNGMKVSPQGDQVIYNIKQNTVWSNFLYKKQIYIKEDATKFNWKILNETKKIGKLTCKKAITSFRGRTYTAWYTPEIAVPYGPWKLNGLPGLILEAYDTNKYVYWYFKSVEYPTDNKEKIVSIRKAKGEKITFLTIKDLWEFEKDLQVRIREKQILTQKQFPNITFEQPRLSDMFIELE
jgi:GLPGLI family protein